MAGHACGVFTDDKVTDWDQLEWNKFDMSAYAVAFEVADRANAQKIVSQPARYVPKALKKGRTEASVKNMTSEQKDRMKAAMLVKVLDWTANDKLEWLPIHTKTNPADVLKTRWALTWKKVRSDEKGAHCAVGAQADGEGSRRWMDVEMKFQKALRWIPREEGQFKPAGLAVSQDLNGRTTIHQKEFIDNIKTIPRYQTQCSVFQSRGPTATIETLFGINKMIRQIKMDPNYKLSVELFKGTTMLVGWSDAAWANRPDGLSAGGYVIGIAPDETLKNKQTPIGWASYRNGKLQRVAARSSLAAEVQALTVAEDELFMVRLMWAELNGFVSDVARNVNACLCVDTKIIYDCLAKQVQMQTLAEKQTALELLACEGYIEKTGLIVIWCRSEANLSDSLTKAAAFGPIELYMRTGCWALVDDEEHLSAKKRKERGLIRPETNKRDFASLIRDAFEHAEISLPDAANSGEENYRDLVYSGPPDRGRLLLLSGRGRGCEQEVFQRPGDREPKVTNFLQYQM
ncbi:unnamed protein product [Prorocentrum cordatum]|uniref:RNA-directed RNA polymerase n=1 Tax=Prorocentrum cordatum TaxID=2364126 RepID=A0ABN9WHX4_9DINO|nr:unnamed protein product [Polarella glacialis]